jgi:hypothetical protein
LAPGVTNNSPFFNAFATDLPIVDLSNTELYTGDDRKMTKMHFLPSVPGWKTKRVVSVSWRANRGLIYVLRETEERVTEFD